MWSQIICYYVVYSSLTLIMFLLVTDPISYDLLQFQGGQ